MTLLRIEDATKSFGGLIAVNHVTFDVAEGEILGLLGPNGSGKTTLINLISRALPITAGEIYLHDQKLTGKRADQVARIGVSRTFQLVRILPSLSLVENVMIPAVFGSEGQSIDKGREIANNCLERVGLQHRTDALAADLTYIDQKRLELARALASNPSLLLLDEWLAGLNPTELKQGIELIRSLSTSGMTIIMVEHIMEAVRALCPRVVVMNSGRLIADEKTAAALSDPAVIAAYLGEVDDA
ncbi:ABC transporter ATP-binding protein [uncultured Cohaesibacter sp.]|uniref:ABC transporter ATP-binding protein n=1 Tax=uncultured Cohaesibacter sp. TaxID=1002546 RepID=UPI0037494D15